MRRWLATFGLLAALTLTSAPARADRAVPDAPPGVSAPLVIQYQKHAKSHKLIIPKKFLEGVKVSELDVETHEGQVSLSGDHGRTVLAGCALSLAIGSVVFLRRRDVSAAVVLVAGALALGAGSLSWADVPVDPPAPAKEKVVIEIVEKGDAVTLIVPARR